MKTLILASYAPSILNFRRSLLVSLHNQGHTLFVVAPSCTNDTHLSSFAKLYNIRLIDVPLDRGSANPFSELITILKIFTCVLRIRPSLTIAYTVKPVIYSGLTLALARFFGIRSFFLPLITGLGFAFTEHHPSLKRSIFKHILSTLYRLSLQSASTVIFQNPDDLEYFAVNHIVSSSQKLVRVWGSGVDLQYFPFSPLPQNHVFLMLSRLLRDKGVVEYIEAARRVKVLYPHAQFYLAGMTDDNPAAIPLNHVRDLIKDGCVTYYGDVTDVRPLLASCRYYVLPSYREGTPRSTLEALSTGRPILTTDVPGCRETVAHNLNGYLVSPRDIDDLSSYMIRLLRLSNDSAQSMGASSRQLAEAKFDVNLVNQDILNCLPPHLISL